MKHILISGPPASGKTHIAFAFAQMCSSHQTKVYDYKSAQYFFDKCLYNPAPIPIVIDVASVHEILNLLTLNYKNSYNQPMIFCTQERWSETPSDLYLIDLYRTNNEQPSTSN